MATHVIPFMQNHMEKNMQHEIKAGIVSGLPKALWFTAEAFGGFTFQCLGFTALGLGGLWLWL